MRNDHSKRTRRLVLLGASLLVVSGCGGGSSDSRGEGAFAAQVRWQQPVIGQSSSNQIAPGTDDPCPGSSPLAPSFGFGNSIPAAAKTIRVLFESEAADFNCCVAFPGNDPLVVRERRIVLAPQLPIGDAHVTVSGYATSFAPANGVAKTCATDESLPTMPCIERFGTPSFLSAPKHVTIGPDFLNDAGDILVFAVPFLLQGKDLDSNDLLQPPPDESFAGRTFSLRVVDALGTIDSNVGLTVVSCTTTTKTTIPLDPQSEPCADGTTQPCNPTGNLDLTGLLVTAVDPSLEPCPDRLTILASNDRGCQLNTSYDFTLLAAAPTPTPTPTPTDRIGNSG